MSTLALSFLGAPQIMLDDTPVTIRHSKALALLIYLAVSGEAQRRDTLATLLWPNSTQRVARSSLRRELSHLNKALGGAWLVIERETIALRPDVWLDVTQLQQLLAEFDRDQPATLDTLSKAIALYRDDFLTGFTLPGCPDFDEWQFFQAESLRQSFATALEALVAVLNEQHAYETAIPHARRRLALDPLHEPAHRQLMWLYAQAGQQAAALRQYQVCLKTLEAELGLPPAAETTALFEQIRAGLVGETVAESSPAEPLARYQILEQLGQGNFAVVYRAYDAKLDRYVALKTLRAPLLPAAGQRKVFEREARTLARLDHPRIVTVYDVVEVDDRLSIVMSLVDGTSLADLLAEQGRLPWSQTLSIIQAVAEGLDFAHAKGILHRDLKPANILLDPQRGPLLSDFGLAKLVSEASTHVTTGGGVVGTPHYIAPEVWQSEGTTRQSDLYALGCIIYELVTGEKLFQGDTAPAVMMAHFSPPALPSIWPADAPDGLTAVLQKTLARQPEARYATAGELAEALTRLDEGRLLAVEADDWTESLQRAVQPRPVFVGREPQLAQLDSALEQALSGQGQLRIVTGEAGAGKTALVTEFLHQAHSKQPDLTIAIGASDAQTGQVDPFLPFREALHRLIRGSTADQSSAWNTIVCLALLEHGPDVVNSFIPPADRPDLVAHAQAAGWRGELPPKKQATLGQQAPDQSKVIEQYIAVLSAVAAHSPLIVVLEDLHWADAASLGLLFRLGRQLENKRLLLLGSYRSEQAHLPGQDTENPLEKMLLELQRQQGKITIDLEAVRLAEGREWIDGLLDTEPNQLNDSFRQALYRHTGGHPLFVVELLADLKERAALVRNQSGDWIIGDKLDWRNLPGRVEGAVAGRIAHLSTEQRWLLTIASVSGERFLAEVVAYVAGSETRQIIQTLSQDLQAQHHLVEAESIERLGDQRLTRYRFRHNLIQVYLYEQLDEVQRTYLHEDVAWALEALYGEQVNQIAVQLARHYQTAGVIQKTVDYLILAGEQALRLSAYDEATQHFNQAVPLLATLPETPEHQQQAFTVQFNLGKIGEALHGTGSENAETAYTHALTIGRQLGESRKIVQVLLALTQQFRFRTEFEMAQTYGQEALHLAEALQDPELLMLANQALLVMAHALGHHGQVVTYGEPVIAFYQARRAALTFDDVYNLVYTMCIGALSLMVTGYPDRALRQAQDGLALAQEREHLFGIGTALGLVASVHNDRSEWQQGMQVGDAMRDFAATHDFFLLRTFADNHVGTALAMLGEVDQGMALHDQAIANREAMGVNIAKSAFLTDLAKACGRAGRVAEGLELVNKALSNIEASGERQSESETYQTKGELLLLQDLPADKYAAAQQEAEACFCQAIEVAQDQGAKLLEARALASLCRLLHSQGRDEGCRQQLAGLYAWFTEGFETEDLRVVQAVLQETA